MDHPDGCHEVPFNSFFGTSDVLNLRESCVRRKPHVQFERRTEASVQTRLLRPDSTDFTELSRRVC